MSNTKPTPEQYLRQAEAELWTSPLIDDNRSDARKTRSVGVIGAGTMGLGIATSLLRTGLPVVVVDQSDEAIGRAGGFVELALATLVKRGALTSDDARDCIGRLKLSTSLDSLADADFVVEAVFERMDVKLAVFAQLGRILRYDTVIASNTSSLDIDQLAETVPNPERVLGLHYFSPAHISPVVEMIKCARTSNSVLLEALQLCRSSAKKPVVMRTGDSFVANRLMERYLVECELMLLEGALPAQIDGALEGFGMAMGPLRTFDMAGLDVRYDFMNRPTARITTYTDLVATLTSARRFGQKNGLGWYRYVNGSRDAIADPVVEELILAESTRKGLKRRILTEHEIVARALLPIVNEAFEVLDEGLVRRESDIDLLYVFGFGFPKSKGGPLYWAHERGLDRLALEAAELKKVHGDRWAMSALHRHAGA